MNRERSQQGILQRLHQAGLRPTIPRVLVMQVLEEAAGEPLAIDEIFRRICQGELHASPGTIYRVVQQLEKLRLVQMLRDEGRKQLYQLSIKSDHPDLENTVQLWAMNPSNGERVALRDGEWRKLLLAAVVDAGLPMDGGRLVLEIDGPAECFAASGSSVS